MIDEEMPKDFLVQIDELNLEFREKLKLFASILTSLDSGPLMSYSRLRLELLAL